MLTLGINRVQQCIFFNSSFRCVFRYTTCSIKPGTSDFTADYLVNSLGFSKEEATVASSKVISPFKSPENPNSVVHFLRNSGFNETQIKKIIFSMPTILSYDVDKTLRPKLKAFKELGLSGSDLADVITSHRHVLLRCVNGHIVPTLAALRSIFPDDDLFLRESLKKFSWVLAPGAPEALPANVALLKSYGLSMEQIKQLFVGKSRYFVMDPKWFQAVLTKVEEKLGIPRYSAMFVHGVYALGGMSEDYFESKMKVFESFGWSDSNIRTLAKNNPHVLALSESKLRSSLNFAANELGYTPAEIASCSGILSLSLERRVIPRNAVVKILKDKGWIKPYRRFCSCLLLTDAKFFDRFVLPFKDEVLDVYTEYRKRAGCAA